VEPAATAVYCVDTVGPSEERLSPLFEIPHGTAIVMKGNATSVVCSPTPIGSPSVPQAGALPSRSRPLLTPGPGTYALGCLATWAHGDVPFFFGVEMVP
jgi:hypothetical protein